MAEDPASFNDIADEVGDELVDTDDTATVFSRNEIIRTLKEKFRAKPKDARQEMINAYRNEINRRQFLMMLGATGAAGVIASHGAGFLLGKKVFSDHTNNTISGMASSDVETIEAAGQTIRVGNGETWENKIIDMSTGQYVIIAAKETNWTIRNIGFDGRDTSDRGNAFFGVADTGGGDAVFENVYLGDGATEGNQGSDTGHGSTGVWVDPEHNGRLDVRCYHVKHMPDNGFYGSERYSGSVRLENCYGGDCYVSTFRVGDNATVENCVAHNTDDGFDGRPLWVWPGGDGETTIRNCHLDAGSYANGDAVWIGRDDGHARVRIGDTRHTGINERGSVEVIDLGGNGNDPRHDPLGCVPMTAEEAATGATETTETSSRSVNSPEDPC